MIYITYIYIYVYNCLRQNLPWFKHTKFVRTAPILLDGDSISHLYIGLSITISAL